MNRRTKTCLLVLLFGLAMTTIPLRGEDTEADIKKLKLDIATNVDYLAALIKTDAERTDDDRMIMKRLAKSQVSTVSQAKDLARTYHNKHTGLRGDEGPRAVGLFKLGKNVKDFSLENDLIWVIRIVNMGNTIRDEMWVSSTTGAVRSMLGGPKDEK
jgi:hypothetical protein